MRALLLCMTLSLASAWTVPATADHCTTWSTSEPEADLDVIYYDDDLGQPGISWYHVYTESNGLDGLQRLDEMKDDTCHGMIEPDTNLVAMAW